MIIAVDFDGTLVLHEFPKIGEEVPLAFRYLKIFQKAQHNLMLWTMRNDGREDFPNVLTEAVEYCKNRGIEFWGVNCNPEQYTWTQSPKQYAHVYIDDAAFGCPLVYQESVVRPYADWSVIGPKMCELLGIIE